MKAVVLTGIRRMELREIPRPNIKRDTDVLVKVDAVGICGSDVHYYTSGGIGSMRVEYPFTVGHEGAGTVEAVGAGVTRVKAGDRVAIEPAMSCGECDQCRAGRPNTCRELKFISCPGEASGCLAEYVVMPERNCYPIPDSMTAEQAAVSEPLSIGLYSIRKSIPMKDAALAVLGTGPIGLSVILAARQTAVRRIYATEKIEPRMNAARSAGADWVGNPGKEDVVAAVLQREPLGPDVVFECCGEQEALDQAVDMLKPGGKLMIVGIPEEERITFDTGIFRRKELTLYYVRREADCVQSALDLIHSGSVAVDFMITHRFPLEQTQQAFDMLADYRDGVIKAIVNVSNT